MAVKTYRKTALVTAEQFRPEIDQIPKGVYSDGHGDPRKRPDCFWVLDTKEGRHNVRGGDYICTGPAGEQWNVAEDIFEATYEEAMSNPDLDDVSLRAVQAIFGGMLKHNLRLAYGADRSLPDGISEAAEGKERAGWQLIIRDALLSALPPPAVPGEVVEMPRSTIRALYRFFHESWIGTGKLYEDGTFSKELFDWRETMAHYHAAPSASIEGETP